MASTNAAPTNSPAASANASPSHAHSPSARKSSSRRTLGALDAQVRKDLRRWLRQFHDEIGLTTLFVTHDQEEALELADQVVVMRNARVEQVGKPQDIYDKPRSPFVMSSSAT